LKNIKIKDEYGTPKIIMEKIKMKYNVNPKLDVCASKENTKCINFFSNEDDALTQQWQHDFFMNPPYSRVKEFMKYAYGQHLKHNVTGTVLVYSKTDTKWWHEFVEEKAEVHFIPRRIHFEVSGIGTINSAPYPSCVIIWRKNGGD